MSLTQVAPSNVVYQKWADTLLMLSIGLVTIPGIVGIDLNIPGIPGARLGRLQPFKILFIAWLAVEAFQFFKGVAKRERLRKIFKSRTGVLLVASLGLLDLTLALGNLAGQSPGRSWSIWSALVLGQVGAFFVFLREAPIQKSVIRGLGLAGVILALFAIMELVFPESALTLAFLKLVRDDPRVHAQLGSSLSQVGLAEFCVRALPVSLFVAPLIAGIGLLGWLYMALGFLTFERSAILAMLLMVPVVLRSQLLTAKQIKIGFFAFVLIATAGVVIKGPKYVLIRFGAGQFVGATNDEMIASHRSTLERQIFAQLAFISAKRHVMTGIGLDGFSAWNKKEVLEELEQMNEHAAFLLRSMDTKMHTHNLFLEMLVSGGVLAFIAFLVASITYTQGAWGLAAGASSPMGWAALIFAFGQWASLLLDARIYVSWLAITLFWFAALAYRFSSEGRGIKS